MKLKFSRFSSLSTVIFAGVLASASAQGASTTWNVDADGLWSTGSNWLSGSAPGATSGTTSTDVATFGFTLTAPRVVTVDANRNIGGITFSNTSAFGYTLSGGNILLTNGGTIQTSGAGTAHTDTISSSISMQGDGGAASFTAGSTTNTRLLVISGNVTGVSTGANVTTLTLNGANTGANTVSGIIGNGTGGGTLSLVKSGAGVWNITNIANKFTGGLEISGGTLNFGGDSRALNNNKITVTGSSTIQGFANSSGFTSTSGGLNVVGSGTTVSISLPSAVWGYTQTGVLEGNGTVMGSGASATGVILNFTNTGNTFTGNLNTNSGTTLIGGFNVASLGDAGQVIFGGTSTFSLAANAVATTFNTRQIVFGTNGNFTANINNNATNVASILTIGTALSNATTGTKTLSLGGTNTGLNVFGGAITNGSGTVAVTKAGTGNWRISGNMSHTGGLTINGGSLTLSGTNSYSGNTNFNGGGTTLTIAGLQAASANTTFVMNTNASTSDSTLRLLDDTGGVNGSTVAMSNTVTIQNNNAGGNAHTFFVGNNNTANGGTSSGTTTGSTISFATLNWNTYAANTVNYGPIQIQGTNGYRLQINSVVLHNAANLASNVVGNTFFTPTTANVTLGTVTVGTGNVNQGLQTLVLDGTSSDNRVTGIISNASDFGTSNRALSLTKSNTSTWTLNGANSYTGATTVTGGRLLLGSTGSLDAASAVTVSGGSLGGTGTVNGTLTVSSTGGIDLRDNAIGDLTLSSTLNITGAAGANNLRFDLGNTTGTSDSLVVAGATTVTNPGAAVITLNQLGGTAGRTATTYTLIGGAGTLAAADFARFSLSTTAAFGQTYALTNTGDDLQLVATNVTGATPAAFWAGTTGVNWSAATNWRDTVAGGGAVAGAPDYQTNVTFSTTTPTPANLANTLDVDFDINSLTFTNASGNVTIGGTRTLTIEAAAVNGNTLGNGIDSQKTSGTNTISAKVALASSQTWTVATDGTLAVSGVVSDFGAGFGLTKAGGGTLTLTGANTYSGGNTITGGILSVNASSVASVNSGPLALSGGGRLTVAGGANVTSASQVSVGSGGGLISVAGNNNFTTTGKLTGSGTLTLVDPAGGGNKNFNFNATDNDFTGGIILSGATSLVVSVNSLVDSANNIAFNAASGTGATFSYGAGAIAPLTLSTRAFEINSAGALTATIQNNNTSHAITINTNLIATGAGAKTLALGAVAGPANVYGGNITDGSGGGTVGVTKTGVGNWAISGTGNTFTGAITLSSTNTSAGTLSYASAGGANAINFSQTTGSATLSYVGAGQTMSGAITASALTSGTITFNSSGAGAVNYSNTASMGTAGSLNKNLILSGTNTGNNILAAGWNNNTGAAATVTKNGTGTWALSGTNIYTGATNVNAGTLLINGNTTSGLVTVANGATLGGTGTIIGGVTVSTGATLSPGASIESLASGALTMATGSTFAYEAANNSTTGADLHAVNGTLSLTNVTLSFDLTTLAALAGSGWTVGNTLTLISYGTTDITSGFVGYTDDTNYTFGSNVWTFDYNDTTAGNNFGGDAIASGQDRFVTLTAFTVVPEPRAALLGAIGGILLLRRRR